MILTKAGFDFCISSFFSDYLVNKQTQYVWNSSVSLFIKANVGIGQDSAFSFIHSAIYIASVFHIFEKRTKSLLSPISITSLSFVDLILQEKSYKKSNTNLFCGYNIISSFFS